MHTSIFQMIFLNFTTLHWNLDMQLHFQMIVTQPLIKLLSVEQAIRLVLFWFNGNNTRDPRLWKQALGFNVLAVWLPNAVNLKVWLSLPKSIYSDVCDACSFFLGKVKALQVFAVLYNEGNSQCVTAGGLRTLEGEFFICECIKSAFLGVVPY